MKDKVSRVLIASFLLVAAAMPFGAALAQTTEGLQIKPAVVEDKATRGEFYRFNLTVNNIASVDKTFYFSTQDITGLDENGLPVFANGAQTTGYEMSSWISVPSQSIDLGAGESKTVELSVHVPNNATPGSHFGAVFLTDKPPKLGTTGSAVSVSVATIISLRLPGDIREEARVRQFSTDKLVYGNPVVSFKTKIENLGNVLVRPHGVIEITDMFGKTVDNVEMNSSAAPVFPSSDRTYVTVWDYKHFAFGRYQAVESISYGDEEVKTVTATTSFFVLPLTFIITVLGSILAVVLIMYAMIQMYIRRKLKEMGVTRGDNSADFYAKKYQRSGSRLIATVIAIFLLCVAFLIILFLMFA